MFRHGRVVEQGHLLDTRAADPLHEPLDLLAHGASRLHEGRIALQPPLPRALPEHPFPHLRLPFLQPLDKRERQLGKAPAHPPHQLGAGPSADLHREGAGGGAFQVVRFIEDHQIMLRQHSGVSDQVGEIERVVGDDQLRVIALDPRHPVRGNHEVGTAGTQTVLAIRSQLVRPELPIDHELQVCLVAVPTSVPRPGQQGIHLRAQRIKGPDPLVGLPELAQADVIRAPFGHRDFQIVPVDLLEEGNILAEELFLQRDGAGRDHGLLAALEDREEIAERLAAAGARLDEGVAAGRNGLLDETRHFELLRSIFGSRQLRQDIPDDALNHEW